MIKKVAIAFIFGFIATILLLQHDHAIQRAVGLYCSQLFHDCLDCNISMKVKSINVFTGALAFERVHASDSQADDWSWRSNELIISFSLWELLPQGKIVVHMQFNDLIAHTAIKNGTFGIVPHIIKAMYGFSPDIPLLLRTISFRNAQLSGIDNHNKIEAFIQGDSTFRFGDQSCQAIFNFIDGAILVKNHEFLSMIDGEIDLEIPNDLKNWFLDSDLRFHLPQLPQQGVNCFCAGNIKAGIGSFMVKSIDDSFTINPIFLDVQKQAFMSATITAPLNIIEAIGRGQQPNEKIKGNGTLSLAYDYNKQPYLSGTITCSDLSYSNVHCASQAALSFAQDGGGWQGTVNYDYSDGLGFHGNWRLANGKKGTLKLSNNAPLCYVASDPWEIPCDGLTLSCSVDSNYKIKAHYQGVAINKKTDDKMRLGGFIAVDKREAALHGTLGDQTYDATVWLLPTLGLKELRYGDGKTFPIHLKGKEYDHRLFSGSIQLASFIEMIEKMAGCKLEGEGKLDLYGIIDYPRLAFKTKFSQGAIRLPHIYNCINALDITGSIDEARQLKIKSLDCTLYEGSFHCKNAYAKFDENWNPTFVYVPLIADHCLINEKKDLFASISGSLLFAKNGSEAPQLSGTLIVNRSHLAHTGFAGAFQELFAQYRQNALVSQWTDMKCDLAIETEHPIHVKTSMLDTQARAQIQLKGQLHAPEIVGSIILDGGSLLFPYKPLLITKGVLTINEQQLNDPLIELVAKNSIKKYLVSLNIQGSINHNEINFSSNPPLKDEQIIGLLFAGSEAESLKSIAPALVMSNMKQMLFGTDPNSLAHRYLDPALKRFSYVHFIPSFNDQSGRGGMRGTFEIEINDRWRAMIQKNFNLSEDTYVELEYLLSDEISVKGIRDEHRDISGEVEMKFKF